jgi:hypothetical protein
MLPKIISNAEALPAPSCLPQTPNCESEKPGTMRYER